MAKPCTESRPLCCHLVLSRNKQDEAQVDVLLLYDGFFQPLYREALGPAMRQLWRDERSVQVR